MKLKLEYMAPYLPYDLRMIFQKSGRIEILKGLEQLPDCLFYNSKYRSDIWNFKPILRPMSDMSNEITIDGKTFVPYIEILRECNFDVDNMDKEEIQRYKPTIEDSSYEWTATRMYLEVVKMFEWHFDIFRLIEKGLAININEI